MIFSLLENASSSWGSKEAVIEKDRISTFSDLHNDALSLSLELESLPIREKSAVGLLAHSGIDFVKFLFSIIKSGYVAVPISPDISDEDLLILSKKSSLSGIVVSPDISINLEWESSKFNFHFNPDFLGNPIAPHIKDPVCIRYTSGTTGEPKGAVFSEKTVIDRIELAKNALDITENDKVLWVMPMAYHFIVSVILYIKNGITIVVPDKDDRKDLVEFSNTHGCTFLYGDPSTYEDLVKNASLKFTSLQRAVCTSSGISETISKMFFEKFDLPISQVFGNIEVGLPLSSLKENNNYDTFGSVGFQQKGYKVEIHNDKGIEVPPNVLGLLAVKGDGLFDGYVTPEVKRDDLLENGWFYTGDLAVKDDCGRFYIKGRKVSCLNISGDLIFPEEIEGVLLSSSLITEAKVYSLNKDKEVFLAADLVRKDFGVTKEQVLNFCSLNLDENKIPKLIYFVESIPKTLTGKISRR